ncbi:uncharacterized protein LOC114933966 isoform X1 [Nylanderia fulva]|uniref:uncharacterized protein LOC114933966 isoform X1 n=1 Tax=Nylanderia fulva TaxID=613905 RepID=UPI0010FB78F1|nr:uncharacterized protein LOC114933966 isoform X1 [Nylanderia fulva]
MKRGPYKEHLKRTGDLPLSTDYSRKKRRVGVGECSTGKRTTYNEEVMSPDARNGLPFDDLHENEDYVNQQELLDHLCIANLDNIDDSNSSVQEIDDSDQQSDTSISDDNNDYDSIEEHKSSSVSDFNEGSENFESDQDEENFEDENINVEKRCPNHDVQCRQVLYEGCDLTKEESVLLIMSVALRHHFTDAALQSFIQTIDCHLPRTCHGSKYLFCKSVPKQTYHVYYFCPQCILILHVDNDCITVKCDNCSEQYNPSQLKKDGKFFIYIPLKEQLIELVNSKVFMQFRQENEKESDVINGKVYRKLKRKNIIGENDITIQWNTDGVQLFNSSLSSLWPILVTINELPYRIRKQQILLTGLWFQSSKPPMNVFLQPFLEELIDLHFNGFESTTFIHQEPILIKVHTLLAPVDSVARSAIQGIKQYNGKYGCPYCYHKRKQICIEQNRRKRVYCGNICTLRKQSHYVRHAEKSQEKNKPVKGVKWPSIVTLIPLFNVISSFPPEYLHSLAEGVIKQFLMAWFDSSNREKDWSLRKHEVLFDKRLMSMKPTSEITRTPQSITQRRLWKGAEYKNFALYYSLICLKGLMPNKYVQHWLLLVYSMHVFLSTTISPNNFIIATFALQKFVLDTEKLYGAMFMNYNIHLMLHIPKAVKQFGALWAWSTFPYEDFNHTIQSLFNGTQYIPEQICKFYSRIRYVKQSSVFDQPNCSKKGKDLFDSIIKECRIKRCMEYGNSLRAFGSAIIIELSLIEKITVEQFLGESVKNKALAYQRFIYQNILYHGSNCTQLKKDVTVQF